MIKHHVLQINVAGAHWHMHTILNDPHFDNFNIILIQDPWWGRIGSQKHIIPDSHTIYGTTNSPRWQLIIPPGISNGEGPGVAIYIRNNCGIDIRFSDIYPSHKDVLAIDVFMNQHCATIVNAYPHGNSSHIHQTANFISSMPIPNDRPVVLCGDFNMHHPEWALVRSKWEKRRPKPYEQEFYEFTRNNDLHLFNEFTTPTRIHPNHPASNSIIDLTFLNSRAADAWPNFNLEVESQDSEHNVGSDHMAVTWTLTPFTPPDQDESDDPDTGDKTSHVIDPALHEDWVSGFSHALEQEDLPSDLITAEDADQYAGAILSAMSSATRQVMPE
ncbi:hypothetical protein OPQ81_011072 [Rhizoctonia solani]|nr:hypothetical protein OPQ81_011072 [Rhizoctonia solani]